MKVPEVNILFRVVDILLYPFMWILGGFTFPIQETHKWHVRKWKWNKAQPLVIKETDKKAIFGHTAVLGLFHMPIFGGLKKYVILEASGYNNYWYVGWEGDIHLLKIRQKRIALLVGKKGFIAYGLGDNGKILKLKIVGYDELGDNKYKDIRLF